MERQLYDRGPCGGIRFPAGLVSRVAQLCWQRGRTVSIIDHGKASPRCDYFNVRLDGELSPDESKLLAAVRQSHLGQIIVDGQRGLHRAIELICRLFYGANVLIPVATKNRVRELHQALRGPLAGRVGAVFGGDWNWNTNRMICTYRSAETARPGGVDIVVFPDVATMRAQKVAEAVANLDDVRRYAIVPDGLWLGRSHSLWLEAACGPVIHRTMPRGGWPARIGVMFCADTPTCAALKTDTVLAQKRADYWHNERRNQLLAEIAQAFREGNIERLWNRGLMLPTDRLSPLRVAVLVESAEHGQSLHALLPNWQLLTSKPGVERTWPRLPDQCIVTQVAANNMPSFDAEVVINATGGEEIPEIKGFPPRSREAQRDVLLVDLADDACQRLERATRARIESYQEHDWTVIAPRCVTPAR